MACRFEVTLDSADGRLLPSARTALDEVSALEASLTVFRDSSELCRVNCVAADTPVGVSRELMSLLSRCRALHAATGGAFDPTSTPLSRAWGFLARRGREPSPGEIEAARARVGMERVVLDPELGTVRFSAPGVELNMGSIGKGWALDRIASGLRGRGLGRALVGAGGSSFLAWGSTAWPLALVPGGRRLGDIWLEDVALATSGSAEQHVEVGGRRLGHVIDPRTGRPAEGVLSASVAAADATTADALATAFLVGGPVLARSWCAANPQTLVLLVLEDDPQTVLTIGDSRRVQLEPAPGVAVVADQG
jgi:thiamine biosynthesis lipoprotein